MTLNFVHPKPPKSAHLQKHPKIPYCFGKMTKNNEKSLISFIQNPQPIVSLTVLLLMLATSAVFLLTLPSPGLELPCDRVQAMWPGSASVTVMAAGRRVFAHPRQSLHSSGLGDSSRQAKATRVTQAGRPRRRE